jgi:tripartite-type tricarboxylate transporter receptor subunit TctC
MGRAERKGRIFWGILFLCGLVFGLMPTPVAHAASFPEKNITLVCPWPPGGSTDLITRTISKIGARYIPKSIVVVNKPGGNGVVATTEMVRVPADGYTICAGTTGLFTSTILVQKKVGYKQDDFDFLVGMTDEPMVVTVHPSSPYKNLNELIRAFKEKDQVIRYSNSGLGGIPQLCGAHLFKFARVKSQPIPFKGGGPAMTAILGAHVDVGIAHPGEALPHIKAGKLRALAISSPNRFSEMPDVPTFKELGYTFDVGVRKYLFAPKGLSPDVRKYLVENLTKCIHDEEFKKTMTSMAIMWAPMTDKEIVDHLNIQYGIMKKIVEELDLAEK